MAAVSAAMLRPPGGGLDPPYYASQMMSYSPTDDKSKKSTWGHRLKLGHGSPGSQGTLRLPSGSNFYGTVGAHGGSALSKSMKYAETWLYGTVRAAPPSPAVYLHYAEPVTSSPVLISTPQQTNYAVVVCSCPEYLNGTKKGSAKKVSICKKCKGSRLPLRPTGGGESASHHQVIGGTMRGPPPSAMISAGSVRAGTVKLQPTAKSRPTILTQTSDPYDLMRRTRLEVVGSQFTAARSRAKSISPVRSRTRRRSPSTDNPKTRSKSVSRSKDLWYEDINEFDTGRRSILECDVNPYDLMRKNDTETYEDDFDNEETFNLRRLKENLKQNAKKHNGPYSKVQAIGGQRIRVFGETSPPKDAKDDFVYDDVDVPQNETTTASSTSPRRPPRRNKSETTSEEDESESDRQKKKIVKQPPSNDASSNIKSILKKPQEQPQQQQQQQQQQQTTPNVSDRVVSGSQFYLPTPKSHHHQPEQQQQQQQSMRKKVQFLVENEIERHDDVDVEDDHRTNNDRHSDDRVEDSGEANEEENCEANEESSHGSTSGDDTPLPKTSAPLRRSQSERLTLEGSPPESPTFMDTMALRSRPSRAHSRQVFVSTQSLVDIVNVDRVTRPKDRPPPPPPSAIDPNSSSISVTIVTSDPKRSTSIVPITTELPEAPPRSNKREPNYVKTRFVRDTALAIESERTTVQVSCDDASSSDSSDSRTKHRLLVRQNNEEDNDSNSSSGVSSNDESNRKTSIMIGGDDCYSTVNVNNDTPIYQSSVTVNNMANPINANCSGNTVTISVYSESEDSDVSGGNSKIYIRNSSELENSKEAADCSTGKTLVVVDYEDNDDMKTTTRGTKCNENVSDMNSDDQISILLRDPVEAVKRNLVPHVCGKAITNQENPIKCESELKNLTRSSFVSKLLEDPMLGHLAEGLETDLVAKLIENSLVRLKESRSTTDNASSEDDEAVSRLIDASLSKLQEERKADERLDSLLKDDADVTTGNAVCSPPYESMEYESGPTGASSDLEPLSDCYNASASEISTEEENSTTRSKFYQMLVDATLSEIEISHGMDDEHHYESIRLNQDPIYEEIGDVPPPLPLSPPPSLMTMDDDKKSSRSIFEGASKYDILSYLVDAKERGIVPEDSYSNHDDDTESKDETAIVEHQRQSSDLSSRVSNLSNGSDSSEDNSLIITADSKKPSAEVERNDSGVGSETSKCSRSRWQGHNIPPNSVLDNITPIHLCEDCDGPVETQVTDSGVMFAPLVCRKCGKKRAERKEIITEIVETEEKYGRDLQIILEEFYQPMLVAGLLTQEQLSAIFLNAEELLENNQSLAERLRDALEISLEQGDEDLLTLNIGKLMLESAPMLHAFSSYCVRQGAASMLLSSLEKEKELLRIFLKVSQMENTVLRRMNLNSFLMVPVQRVTKYPLLLSRLYKVTPHHLDGRELLKQAQQKIEQHLSHMNSEAKDVTTLKLWKRISSGNNGRRSSSEIDMINIKLRKLAVDVLEWNHDEARFAMEGKLLFTQPNDSNWRKGRTIKLTPINALLVTNGKPTAAYKPCEARGPCFPRNTGIREASLVLARDKGGRTALLREPLYLDRCVVAAESDWDDYFELQEIVSKDTYIFKAEDSTRTKQWCQQLQYHCQGMGAWRRRRNALANIMINGMMTRN